MATGMRFFYSLKKKPEIRSFEKLRQLLWVQFGIMVKIPWCDTEQSFFSKAEVKEIEHGATEIRMSVPSTPCREIGCNSVNNGENTLA